MRAGKNILQRDTEMLDNSFQKSERKKEKQKILDKLEELERIQKFN